MIHHVQREHLARLDALWSTARPRRSWLRSDQRLTKLRDDAIFRYMAKYRNTLT